MDANDFEYRPFPPERAVVVDAGYQAARRHVIYGLLEVDISRARTLLRDLSEQTNTRISFTAFVVTSLGRAIADFPAVQAYRDWRGRLVIFRDVDVVTMIEPEAGRVAIPHIIREANRKSVLDISAEIRAVQARPASSDLRGGLTALAPRVPRFVRMVFYRALKLDPRRFRRTAGTAIVTSVGMFGKHGGWGIAFLPMHTVGVTVGGIVEKPGLRDGKIEVVEYLNLTLAFDHDVVDGAPAARFGRRFTELLESAAVLRPDAGARE